VVAHFLSRDVRYVINYEQELLSTFLRADTSRFDYEVRLELALAKRHEIVFSWLIMVVGRESLNHLTSICS
jgi:hypothetical protein